MNDVVAQASHKARQLIEEGKSDAVSGFLKIGAGFNLVVQHKLHRAENMTLAQYISTTGMSWAKAHQAMKVASTFGHLQVEGILHTRLIELSPLRLDEPGKAEAISAARELGPRDFERFVAEKKGRKIPEDCDHAEQVTICSKCRARLK
mgnify:CR=1 FL=1